MLLLFIFNARSTSLVRAVEAQYRRRRGRHLARLRRRRVWSARPYARPHHLDVPRRAHLLRILFPAARLGGDDRARRVSRSSTRRGWCGITSSAAIPAASPFIPCSMESVTREAGAHAPASISIAGCRPGSFRTKIADNLLPQMGRIFEYLGWSVVALMFFVSLLHLFERPETAAIRWLF